MTVSDAWKEWRAHCELVQSQTTKFADDTPAKKAARISKARRNYNYFVQTYFPHFAHCDCAKFQIEAAEKVRKTANLNAVFMWPRGHAKSTHFDIFIPLWLKIQTPRGINVMVLVGKSQDNANTLLGDIQAELEYNQRYIADFGEQKSAGSWEDGQFVTEDGCAFFARGRGQSPRGLRYRDKRPDYIVADDLDDDELCENPDRVRKMTEWVRGALFGAKDGDNGRFLMAGNLISKNSVLYNVSKISNVYLSRVDCYDSKGHIAWPEKFSKQALDNMQEFMGYRLFQREEMNNPITEGAVFRNEWVRWGKMLPLKSYEMLVCYIDPSWKSTGKNDYKACKLWGKCGLRLDHIRAFVRQCSVVEMVRWLYDLYESLPENVSVSFYMEASFMQDMILDEFGNEGKARGYQLPISADRRQKPNKFLRIENVSPLWERGCVTYNEAMKDDPDMLCGIEQTLAFEKGSSAHDDAPDADEGAIWILQKSGREESMPPMIGRNNSTNSKNIW
jgi:predicted phage terminase large subunit-like protein